MTLPLAGIQVRIHHDKHGLPYLNPDDLQMFIQSGREATFAEQKAIRELFAEAAKKKGSA